MLIYLVFVCVRYCAKPFMCMVAFYAHMGVIITIV